MNQLTILAVLLAVVAGGTWWETKSHYQHQYDALVQELRTTEQQNEAVAKKQLDAQTQITAEVQHAAQVQLAGRDARIVSLLNATPKIVTRYVPQATGTASCPAVTTDITTGTGPDQAAGPAQPATEVSTLDTSTLKSVLQVGIDSLTSEILWRQWATEEAK